MPKTKRDLLKRRLAQAHHDLHKAAENIIPLEQQFRGPHADLANILALALVGLDNLLQLIDVFADRAWGYHPDDYETWRNPRKTKPGETDDSEDDEENV